jgi:hypothetical protein
LARKEREPATGNENLGSLARWITRGCRRERGECRLSEEWLSLTEDDLEVAAAVERLIQQLLARYLGGVAPPIAE